MPVGCCQKIDSEEVDEVVAVLPVDGGEGVSLVGEDAVPVAFRRYFTTVPGQVGWGFNRTSYSAGSSITSLEMWNPWLAGGTPQETGTVIIVDLYGHSYELEYNSFTDNTDSTGFWTFSLLNTFVNPNEIRGTDSSGQAPFEPNTNMIGTYITEDSWGEDTRCPCCVPSEAEDKLLIDDMEHTYDDFNAEDGPDHRTWPGFQQAVTHGYWHDTADWTVDSLRGAAGTLDGSDWTELIPALNYFREDFSRPLWGTLRVWGSTAATAELAMDDGFGGDKVLADAVEISEEEKDSVAIVFNIKGFNEYFLEDDYDEGEEYFSIRVSHAGNYVARQETPFSSQFWVWNNYSFFQKFRVTGWALTEEGDPNIYTFYMEDPWIPSTDAGISLGDTVFIRRNEGSVDLEPYANPSFYVRNKDGVAGNIENVQWKFLPWEMPWMGDT